MFTLYHHPFCPLSRAVRISMGEYGIGAEFIEERLWERRRGFLEINPANTLPVMIVGGAWRLRRADFGVERVLRPPREEHPRGH